ncbi:MAG: hypothetical protein H0V50_00340, partial [Thermoleophilaceae bacterium]|nr:hypothetical protein [Thermoleophilaceae bacterium]
AVPGYGQRYVTSDGRATLIKDTSNVSGAPAWHFMRSECIDRVPTYIGQIDNAPGSYFPFSNRLRRPSTLDSYRSDYVVTNIRWRSWGGDSARGSGTFTLYLCNGPCSRRVPVRRHARLKLDQRRGGFCHSGSAAFYTRLTVDYRLIDETEPSGFRVRKDGERFRLDPACSVRNPRDVTTAP